MTSFHHIPACPGQTPCGQCHPLPTDQFVMAVFETAGEEKLARNWRSVKQSNQLNHRID